jgi:hypothetical protein
VDPSVRDTKPASFIQTIGRQHKYAVGLLRQDARRSVVEMIAMLMGDEM